jgi:hypothetical protein
MKQYKITLLKNPGNTGFMKKDNLKECQEGVLQVNINGNM